MPKDWIYKTEGKKMVGEFFKYIGLSIVTFGVYAAYWHFKVMAETRDAVVEIASIARKMQEVSEMRDTLK